MISIATGPTELAARFFQETLTADYDLMDEVCLVWEGAPPLSRPTNIQANQWSLFPDAPFPCVSYQMVSPIGRTVYSIGNPGVRVITSMQWQVKVIHPDSFKLADPILEYVRSLLNNGSGTWAGEGDIQTCQELNTIPRARRTAASGKIYYHVGYEFAVMAARVN